MANLYCITEELLKSSRSLQDFTVYKGKLSREDVATLIETFEKAIEDIPVELMVGVLKNSNDLFAFLIDKGGNGDFDFYRFLNSHYEGTANINPVNARLMFPRNLSRGIYTEYNSELDNYDDNAYNEDEDEGATGYIDEEPQEDTIRFALKCDSTGDNIEVTPAGTIIGRSVKAQYSIKTSSNLSRQHAKVFLEDDICFLEDLGSVNGSFINGNRLAPNARKKLDVGDIVMLADEKFTLVLL